jgi:UDP-3-O-[3-hydroxymyristoyl] glucosamine N-acyltransferase
MRSIEIGKIHPTAIIAESAKLGRNVTVGAYSIIHENVIIEDHSVISARCTLGEPLTTFYSTPDTYQNPQLSIGMNALIRSETLVYAGSQIGNNFQSGHRVTIRESTKIGENVRIGTLSDVQGHCFIGDHSRLHSNVFVAPNSKIGQCVWLLPHTVLTNDPRPPSDSWCGVTIDDFAVIAAMSVL